MRPSVTLADSGYGDNTGFRDGLTKRGLIYNVAVKGGTVVWRPGIVLRLPKSSPGKRGRPRTRPDMGDEQPITIAALAKSLGRQSYRRVIWRAGSRGKLASYFAAVRVRRAHGHAKGEAPGDEQWLICEWPKDEKEPTKFYLSTQPAKCSVKELVRTAHLRWRVERDYQDMKQEVGLDSYEGRTWRGFHHHAALCAAAHAFLALRRALFPPKQGAVDVATGAPSPSANPPRQTRGVPPVPPTDELAICAVWAVTPVIVGLQNAIR